MALYTFFRFTWGAWVNGMLWTHGDVPGNGRIKKGRDLAVPA